MRIDRFLSNLPRFNRQQVRVLLVQRRIRIDGQPVSDPKAEVREFSRVELDDEVLQAGKPARYFMLHKPMGCVSATRDPEHKTVLELIHEPDPQDLHIAGRLDYNTTGLMLITNDGNWSRRLTQPQTKLPKLYYVETEQEIGPEYVETFARGLYFAFEDLTTLPAQLQILGPRSARLSIVEGRYHQVKRMFGHFNNKVLRLHRERMGPLLLDERLAPGEYRALSDAEIRLI
ncbi:16S rRNA pseudouridine516 synthase [Pseudomonas protegens]|uniref:Pseudouridine synthase n=2 Tax=Pseudomonas TaxID=286 RepID=A0A2C9EHY2_PSEPH|nr:MULTISPECIES: pseudouridine synthase [Pseudomonas]AGL83254.1 ribosomal small subunit pseudouridine synthase A [Pseudomonas protegens CHA0]MBB1613174.1 16S rRNA pseudouridine(516) synthase [Pseudomonas sp. UMC65]MBB1619119.1 16S rRNA pseudouridine(516) synthase [Pseudomonas sp. UME65]MBP5098287.1 pseudouridine synthase [Pseudomonas protegens]MBP5103880.1 pseudouridine synthase [Pseudomonas protegens]